MKNSKNNVVRKIILVSSLFLFGIASYSQKEEKNGTISIRRHGQEGKGNISVTIEEFAAIVDEEIKKTLKVFTV